jgi:hypothetical protein
VCSDADKACETRPSMRVGNLWVRSLRPRAPARTPLRNHAVSNNTLFETRKFLIGLRDFPPDKDDTWEPINNLPAYTRVHQVAHATDPRMWWKQHVQDFPRLARMARQYLAVPATLRLLRDDFCILNSSTWNRARGMTHTHTLTETYTHLPLRHWHTLVIVTDTTNI